MPSAKKSPTDIEIRAKIDVPHKIQDRANTKKWKVLQKPLIDAAIQAREMFPDDANARHTLFQLLVEAAKAILAMLEKRSGYAPPPLPTPGLQDLPTPGFWDLPAGTDGTN